MLLLYLAKWIAHYVSLLHHNIKSTKCKRWLWPSNLPDLNPADDSMEVTLNKVCQCAVLLWMTQTIKTAVHQGGSRCHHCCSHVIDPSSLSKCQVYIEDLTNKKVWICDSRTKSILKMIWQRHMKHRWLGHVLRHENFSTTLLKGNDGQSYSGYAKDRVTAWYNGKGRLWKVERSNIRQIKMETGQQVRKHFWNLLETAED